MNNRPNSTEHTSSLRRATALFTAAAVTAPLGLGLAGCEQLPGDEPEQGAAIGAGGGALAGAALSEDDRALGALIGGLLGAGGGYLVGSRLDKDADEAREAQQEAQQDPATAAEVAGTDSADLDDNGFVTLDEVIAMEEAGLQDQEMISRLRDTEQVFRLSDDQEDRLRQSGVSEQVITAMPTLNREMLRSQERETDERISRPAP